MTETDRAFVKTVKTYHRRYGRHDLPWRQTSDPYHILVSEMMLQQTQVARVVPKYQTFMGLFPSAEALAAAPLGAVLRAWQGLGYNRRAKLLHECVRFVSLHLEGKFPTTRPELMALPGIGPYTASAIMAFAYNLPVPVIETNIRTVYLHHFFKDRHQVSDADLLPVIERTLDRRQPCVWYAALMDYGVHLKATIGNQNNRSRHYQRQAKFQGSDRQVRGAIVRRLALGSHTDSALTKALGYESYRLQTQLTALEREGLIEKRGRSFQLPA